MCGLFVFETCDIYAPYFVPKFIFFDDVVFIINECVCCDVG